MKRLTRVPLHRPRIILGAGLLITLVTLTVLVSHHDPGLHGLQHAHRALQAHVTEHPWPSAAAFFLAYVAVTALSLPIATLLALAAGAAFGVIEGTLLVSFASTLGATLAMLASRFLFRDWVRRRGGARIARVEENLRRDGAFYLFSLRLVPAVPFVLVNLFSGLAPIRVTTYWWVSQLGMLPATVVFVNAGMHLGELGSLRDVLSAPLIVSLLLLAALPWTMRAALARLAAWRHRRGCPCTMSTPDLR